MISKHEIPSLKRTVLLLLALILTSAPLLAMARPVTAASGSDWADLPVPSSPQDTLERTVSYTYDATGRLTSADYGEGVGINFAYDAAGNLISASLGGNNIYLPIVIR